MENQKKILFIDDETLPMKFYHLAFQHNGYQTHQIDKVDEVMDYLVPNANQISTIILDIMMPPRGDFKIEQTKGGLETGFHLYEKIKEIESIKSIPLIVLTNLDKSDVITQFKEKNVDVRRKLDTPPFELIKIVERLLESKME